MRNIIKKTLLENDSFTIFEAENGQDAIEVYKTNSPDLVTMDISMDLKNGVEAAEEILNYNPNAKIIMITSLGQEKLLSQCVQVGIQDYIVKPFSKQRLLSTVQKTLDLCEN